MSCFHHIDDVGTSFGFVIRNCGDGAAVDLSTPGTVVTAFFRNPTGTPSSGAATITSATEGRVTYVRSTAFGDAGPWRRWARAVIPGVGTFTSTPVDFYVNDNEAA